MFTRNRFWILIALLMLFLGVLLVQHPARVSAVSPWRLPFIGYYGVSTGCPDGSSTHRDAAKYAIDFLTGSGGTGTPLYAPVDGNITFAGWDNRGYGNLVVIEDSDSNFHYLAHLNKIYVSQGWNVNIGDLVGLSGNSGYVVGENGGYHLHYHVQGGPWDGNSENQAITLQGSGISSMITWSGNCATSGTGPDISGNPYNWCPTFAANNVDDVMLFDHKECKGNYKSLQTEFPEAVFPLINIFDNRTRSIYVPSGKSVFVADDVASPSSRWYCVTEDKWNLDNDYYQSSSTKMGWQGGSGNSMISWAMVFDNSNCTINSTYIGNVIEGGQYVGMYIWQQQQNSNLLAEFGVVEELFDVEFHVRVNSTGGDDYYDAMQLCVGTTCFETSETEHYWTWNKYGLDDGLYDLKIRYRTAYDSGNWANAEIIHVGDIFLSPVRQAYAPCGEQVDGVQLTSGSDCVIVTQTVSDLAPAGWSDRSSLYVSVVGDLEGWLYNSVNFDGAPYVLKSEESGPVGNNVSSIEVKPLSPDPPENPYQPFEADGNTVGLWHFDEGSGTTLYDSAGSYDGSLASGNSWVSGKFDDGLYFPNPPDGGGANFGAMYVCPITFEAWIKTTNEGGRLAGQLGGGQNTGVNKWLLYVDNKKPKLEIWSSGGSQATTGYKEMSDGNWHYLMWTYDCSTTAKLYMDNELVGNLTTASQWDGAGSATTFEVGSPGQQSRCNCNIDDVRISNIVRVPVAQPTPTPTPEPTQTATPTPTASPVPNTVTLFESAGYYATQYGWNTPGTYGVPSEMNDRASALQVTSGWSVMLYLDGSQQGASVCRNADDSDFAGDTYNGGAGLNDSVSSVEVFDDPNCGSATPTPTPTTAPTVISLFEDSAYAGNTVTFSSEGVYNLSSFNDMASSLQIASGWSVMLYEHADRGGDSVCRIGDDGNFNDGDTFDGAIPLNDRVSSIEVFHDINCNGQLANTVVLFESAGYYASQYGWNVPGSYELPSEMNDRASALKVTSGWSVKLYSDGSQQGNSVCRSADDSDFSGDTYDGGAGLNDSVSSVQVFHNSNCTP